MEAYISVLVYLFSLSVFPGYVFLYFIHKLMEMRTDYYSMIFLSLGFLSTPLSVFMIGTYNSFTIIIGSLLVIIGLSVHTSKTEMWLWLGFSAFFNTVLVLGVALSSSIGLVVYGISLGLMLFISSPFSGEGCRICIIVESLFYTSFLSNLIFRQYAGVLAASLLLTGVVLIVSPYVSRILYRADTWNKSFDRYVSICGSLLFVFIGLISSVGLLA